MDVEKVFHMKGGLGETSYSRNSQLLRTLHETVNPTTMKAIEATYISLKPKSIGIADLGCSTGPNALSNIKGLVDAVEKLAKKLDEPLPEFRMCLNDLPMNDFNTIFRLLPDFYKKLENGRKNGAPSIYIAVYPGNFYGRLFPENSMHFMYSFSCLHWLSTVTPGIYDERGETLNKKSIYISRNSPPSVCKAYAEQFQADFSVFLKSRSQEMLSGGRMVLTFVGRMSRDPYDKDSIFHWELLYKCFYTLVSQGEIKEEKLDSYETHFYSPCKEEIEDAVRKQGSFTLDVVEMVVSDMDGMDHISYGKAVAKTVRAVQESLIANHFGEAILDDLFDEYGKLFGEQMAAENISPLFNFLLVLRKLH